MLSIKRSSVGSLMFLSCCFLKTITKKGKSLYLAIYGILTVFKVFGENYLKFETSVLFLVLVVFNNIQCVFLVMVFVTIPHIPITPLFFFLNPYNLKMN